MDNARSGRLGPQRPHDYFYSVPDHTDTLPNYTTYARETGELVAVTRPLAHNGRVFWKLTDARSEELAWLAFTRPDARAALARRKVWTLIPYLQEFLANWFVSVDRVRANQRQWVHTNIDIEEARELALSVPQPQAADIKRITRPEAVLTINDIDRVKVTTVLGKGTAQALKARR